MKKKTAYLFITIIALVLFILNYSWMDGILIKNFESGSEEAFVLRIVDGDTIDSSIGKIRLLGINTPEKGERGYQEAKDFLNKTLLNKTVTLEFGKDKKDRYNRTLAYIFLESNNINLEIVKRGFANPYFPSGKDEYYSLFYSAWEECVKEGDYYCKNSEEKCAKCIGVKSIDTYDQEVVFSNVCDFVCNIESWSVKDEGRKVFVFNKTEVISNSELKLIVGNKTSSENVVYWKRADYVWTSTGDALFLRDSKGDLVTWKRI